MLAFGVEKRTIGAVVSLMKVRESEPVFPAASVCEAVMDFVPSAPARVILALNEPLQLVVTGAAKSPESVTVSPLTQVPLIVSPP